MKNKEEIKKYKIIIDGCNHGVKTWKEIVEYVSKNKINIIDPDLISIIPCSHENDFYDYKELEYDFYQENLDNKEFNTDGYELKDCGHYEQN